MKSAKAPKPNNATRPKPQQIVYIFTTHTHTHVCVSMCVCLFLIELDWNYINKQISRSSCCLPACIVAIIPTPSPFPTPTSHPLCLPAQIGSSLFVANINNNAATLYTDYKLANTPITTPALPRSSCITRTPIQRICFWKV